jgi:hypothetical protein
MVPVSFLRRRIQDSEESFQKYQCKVQRELEDGQRRGGAVRIRAVCHCSGCIDVKASRGLGALALSSTCGLYYPARQNGCCRGGSQLSDSVTLLSRENRTAIRCRKLHDLQGAGRVLHERQILHPLLKTTLHSLAYSPQYRKGCSTHQQNHLVHRLIFYYPHRACRLLLLSA